MNTKRPFQIKKFIGDRAFYKRYLMLALPMILQNAITNLVSFLDNIMVGQLGTEQMSGVAIVNQLIFVYNLAIFGAASAASIFGAQYFGKGNHEGHMYSFRFKLYATMFVTILAITLFITNGENLISLYLTDTAGTGATDVALRYGKQYLSIMLIGLVPFAVTQSYATNIKETGQTFVPMAASFVAVGSNAVLDYLLIFGIGPFPKLGVMGAALATILARYIEAAIIVWGLKLRPRFSPGYGDFSIAHQRDITRELDTARRLGLTVTESLMLAPMKSVTAVIGLSETGGCTGGGCEACAKTDCDFRRL